MFRGEFAHSVDAKGRIIIPSKFRDLLQDEFVITKGFDNCIALYDMDNWISLEKRLAQMPMMSADARIVRRLIVGSACEVSPDKQGRILLSQALREYAGIEKDAVILGNIDHVEIWDKERWRVSGDISADVAAEKLYASGINL